MIAAARRSEALTLLGILGMIVAAWAFSIWAELTGAAAGFHHHTLYHAVTDGSLPLWAAILRLAGAWQLMTAAMMLPSSLPMVRLYAVTARRAPSFGLSFTLFLVAYFAVWTAFAVPALIGDMGLHWLVHSWLWLDQHAFLIPTATLGLAAGWHRVQAGFPPVAVFAHFDQLGWLDSRTVIGHTGPSDELAYVRLQQPTKLVDLGLRGAFVGS